MMLNVPSGNVVGSKKVKYFGPFVIVMPRLLSYLGTLYFK